jgi:hypothetical protein
MRLAHVLTIGLFAVLGSACSSSSDPEKQISKAIAEMQVALEEGKNAAFSEHLADSFLGGHKGQRNIGKDEVRKMLAGYFLRYRNIGVVIPSLSVQVDAYEPALATTRGTAALTGGNARLPETARLYQFTGQWRLIDGRWQLIQFSWE